MTAETRSIRLKPDMWAALDRLARADQRTTASLIRKALDDYIRARPDHHETPD